MEKSEILNNIKKIIAEIDKFNLSERIEIINEIRHELHLKSPFKNEPVDFIQWVPSKAVQANDYNPNAVAPPEMELLKHSIEIDGYTQPIVAWKKDKKYEVIDGFHRNRVGKEYPKISKRIKNYLPLTIIKKEQEGRNDRIASTIRHNRARGKHTIGGMSDIVLELKGRNWSSEKIAKELGMEQDEILRLCQITGLAELFSDQEFSKAWDIEDSAISEFAPIDDDMGISDDLEYRHLNVDDPDRTFHQWHTWECYRAGFYDTSPPRGMTKNQCEKMFGEFLKDTKKFADALEHIIKEWKYSCEHYLTNKAMNRIAWLGQAAVCYSLKIPATFRGGWNFLTETEKEKANKVALTYLNKWLKANNKDEISIEEAQASRQSDIY